ncbi:hypothetical protein PRUB_a2541 [Pseudoalteromonas rubra]|uniref:Uncharacterized protein n=1 Tax=Pseudoalteromonas rubra TaxID=43658 RepID=A0A8T0CB56_9GAMM|nr:hypothetical protein [Pseudoalteromonas rubra]KAF7787994.1 hypothetical protein PRUB_a2541 [Pseudoalteromonas rubra]
MFKKASSTLALLVMSFGSAAATYQVDVNLVVERAPLQIAQTTAMSFPELLVNEASKNGDSCYAIETPMPNPIASALCNDANVGGKRATFTVSGTPHAQVVYTFSAPDQTQDGLRFTMADMTAGAQLDNAGEASVSFAASIVLDDKDVAINAPGTKSFSYDFVAAYQ